MLRLHKHTSFGHCKIGGLVIVLHIVRYDNAGGAASETTALSRAGGGGGRRDDRRITLTQIDEEGLGQNGRTDYVQVRASCRWSFLNIIQLIIVYAMRIWIPDLIQ